MIRLFVSEGPAGFLDFGCMPLNEPEAHQTAGRGTCVILCRPGAAGPATARSVAIAPPRELMSALERKGLSLQICASHAEALAELVVNERELRTGIAQRPMVLLLLEPEATPGISELVDRVNRFAPRALVWRYSPSHRPPLTAWTSSRPAASPSPRVEIAARAQPAPALRLTDAEPPARVRGEVPPRAQDSLQIDPSESSGDPHKSPQTPSGPILTQEELSMLLSDDWESHT